jgi:hypothetical protein
VKEYLQGMGRPNSPAYGSKEYHETVEATRRIWEVPYTYLHFRTVVASIFALALALTCLKLSLPYYNAALSRTQC